MRFLVDKLSYIYELSLEWVLGTTNVLQRSWEGLFYHFAFIEKMNSGESCISNQFLTIFLSSDEMLMFSLGLCCTFFVLKIMISTQISSGMVSGCWPKSRRPTLETENPWFCSCEMQSENITNRERWFVGDFYDCLLWFDLVHFGIYWYSQVKYRRGSVWRVLQAEGVFGEKIAVESTVWTLNGTSWSTTKVFLLPSPPTTKIYI